MKKKIDWLNHFLEFIVVLIGILLAFQLNNWSVNKSHRKVIKTHLLQIRQETELNLQSIKYSISLAETNLSKLDSIFVLIHAGGNFARVNKLALDLLGIGGSYFKKNAYSSFTESGDIRFMQDLEAKQKIIGLYEYYKWVHGFEQLSLDDFNNDYYPYIKEHFDITNGAVQDEKIYTCKQFKNNLGAYQFLLKGKLVKYKDCEKEINAYLKTMKK